MSRTDGWFHMRHDGSAEWVDVDARAKEQEECACPGLPSSQAAAPGS